MGNHFIKTIWMFKFAKGQSLSLWYHLPLRKHRYLPCKWLCAFVYFKSAGITVCILFQVLESINSSYLVSPQTEQSLQQISSQFPDSLRLDSLEKSSETKVRFTSFFFYMAGAGQTVNFSVAWKIFSLIYIWTGTWAECSDLNQSWFGRTNFNGRETKFCYQFLKIWHSYPFSQSQWNCNKQYPWYRFTWILCLNWAHQFTISGKDFGDCSSRWKVIVGLHGSDNSSWW